MKKPFVFLMFFGLFLPFTSIGTANAHQSSTMQPYYHYDDYLRKTSNSMCHKHKEKDNGKNKPIERDGLCTVKDKANR
jgi:hypothetical protein